MHSPWLTELEGGRNPPETGSPMSPGTTHQGPPSFRESQRPIPGGMSPRSEPLEPSPHLLPCSPQAWRRGQKVQVAIGVGRSRRTKLEREEPVPSPPQGRASCLQQPAMTSTQNRDWGGVFICMAKPSSFNPKHSPLKKHQLSFKERPSLVHFNCFG